MVQALFGLCLAFCLGIMSYTAAQAQTISGQDPAINEVSVDTTSSITATASTALNGATVTAQSFAVHSQFRGYYTDVPSINGTDIILNPAQDFFMGEQLQVVATDGIQDSGGAAITPIQWGLTAGHVNTNNARIFTEDTSHGIGKLQYPNTSWADVDGDNDLDLLMVSGNPNSGASALYLNDGSGNFTNSGQTIDGVHRVAISWGDIDGDGDPDFLHSGYFGGRKANFYINNGSGTFTKNTTIGQNFASLDNTLSTFGDVDNDGDLDLFYAGQEGSSPFAPKAFLYFNDGNGNFTVNLAATAVITPVKNGSSMSNRGPVAFGDSDNDGDLDLLVTGLNSSNGGEGALYLNDGNGIFSLDTAATAVIQGVFYSSATWADATNDGWLDILITGQGGPTALYINDGSGGFTASSLSLPQLSGGSAAWGDADNDGDLDFFIQGSAGGNQAQLYLNDGSGNFTLSSHNFPVGSSGDVEWADIDGDMDLDFILAVGTSSATNKVHLYLNQSGPEMAVLGNTLVITSSSASPTTTNHTDFGLLDANATPIAHTFTISNSGEAPLNLIGSPRVDLSGATSAFAVTTQPSSGSLAGGSTITFTVTFDPISTGTVTATVSISNTDSNENPYTFVIQGTGVESDLRIAKSASAIAGSLLTYTLNISNVGDGPATGVLISDTLPTGLALAAPITIQGASASAIGTLPTVVSGLTINPGTAITLTIPVSISKSVAGLVLNTATVTSTQSPTTNLTRTSQVTITIPTPDLQIAKTATPNLARAGDMLTYTLAFTNAGPGLAYDVTITDTLPNNVTYGSTLANAGFTPTQNGSILTFFTPTLTANATGNIIYTVMVNPTAIQPITNSVEINSVTAISGTGPLTATTVTALAPPILGLTKSVTPTNVSAGDMLMYTIVANNSGGSNATGALIADTLPTGLNLAGAITQQGGSNGTIGTLPTVVSGLTIAAGESITVTLPVTVDKTIAGVDIVNTATVTSVQLPTANLTQTGQATITVLAPDLQIAKSTPISPVRVGDVLNYTLIITNAGLGSASDVVITDTLPSNVSYTSMINNGGFTDSQSGSTLTLSTPTLVPGVTTVNFSVTVLPTHLEITNTVEITSVTPLSGTGPLNDTIVTALVPPELGITKLADPEVPYPGGPLAYTIIVSNTGGSNATNVAIADTLPTGLNYVAGSLATTAGTTGSFPNILSGATIIPGQSITTSFMVTSDVAIAGTFVMNEATVVADQLPTVNITQTAQVTVLVGAPELSIAKAATPDPVEANELLTYTLTIRNDGVGPAFNTVVTDSLPSNVTFNNAVNLSGFTLDTSTPGSVAFLTPTLPAMTVNTIIYNVRVNAPTIVDITNNVEITSTTFISGNGPLTATVTTALAPPLLGIAKSVQPLAVESGDLLTYTIVLHNSGGSNATNATIQDVLPANMHFVGPVTIMGTTGTPGTAATLPMVASGLTVPKDQSITVTVPVTVDFGLADQTIIQNTASVTSAKLPTPVSGSAPVTILAPGIAIDKSANTVATDVNGTIQYTYEVMNSGSVVLSGITVQDTPLGPVTLASTTLAPGEVTTGTLSYGPVPISDFFNSNPITNVVLATGYSPIGAVVTATDSASVDVLEPTPTFTPFPTATSTPTPTPTPNAYVSLSPANVVVNEGAGTAQLDLILSNALGVPVNVTLDSFVQLPDYATAALDYAAFTQAFTFQPGETSKIISVIINQDSLVEPTEQFRVIIEQVSGGGAAIQIGANESLITILDDDVPTATPTMTMLPTDTVTPTPTPTLLSTDTAVPTNTALPTDTPVPADTVMPTDTAVPANTAMPTDTSVPADTVVPADTPVLVDTPVPTATDTPIPTFTSISTSISTSIPTVTTVPNATPAPIATAVPTATAAPITTAVPTATPTFAPTALPEATATPTPTGTPVPTATALAVPTATSVPIATATVAPTDMSLPTNTATALPVDTATTVPTETAVPGDTAIPTDVVTAVPTATAVATATDMPAETTVPTAVGAATAIPVATMTLVPTNMPEVPQENPTVDPGDNPIIDPADIFDPAGPTPESVVQETDPATGEINDPRLAGLIFKTKVRAEENPNERNEIQRITPGGVAIFVISFENNTPNPLYGVVIRIFVPANTTFRQAGSGVPPMQVVAAGTNAEGDPPPFQQVAATINQSRGTEWELADLSGPCPDGAPAGTECIFRLGTVQPGESGELSLPATVNEDAPTDTRFALDSTLGAANLAEGLLIAINDEASVETVAEVVTEPESESPNEPETEAPTALDQNTEPSMKVFLPLISR